MDGFINVKFFYWHEGENAERIESMWTIPVGDNNRIENIPFYVKSFALGDIISAKEVAGELYVDELIEESGHSTVRVVFFDHSIIARIREELKQMGCDSEVSDRSHLIALDIPPDINYQGVIRPFLNKGFEADLWDYEEACLSKFHNR